MATLSGGHELQPSGFDAVMFLRNNRIGIESELASETPKSARDKRRESEISVTHKELTLKLVVLCAQWMFHRIVSEHAAFRITVRNQGKVRV